MDDLVKQSRDALDGVTEGPWRLGSWMDNVFGTGPNGEWFPICRVKRNDAPIEGNQDHKDARFIAAARQLVPAMADEIERLRGEVARMRGAVKVKPLVWVQSGGSHVMDGESHTVPTGYTVRFADENGWKWSTPLGAYGWERSPKSAKAAAQDDHETRVLSALDLQP